MTVAGGGTGGHVFPGIALAEAFLSVCPGGFVSFVGTEEGLEATAVPARGFEIDFVPAGQIRGKGAGGLRGAARMIGGLGTAASVVRRRRPDLVLGVGGYASVPVSLAAWGLGIPLFLQEQNSVPGRSNRALARLARRVYTGFERSASRLPAGKAVWTGNPVRREIEDGAEACGGRFPEGPFTVLALGGSQGARAINDLVVDMARTANRERRPIRFLLQTGSAGFPAVEERVRKEGLPVETFPFTERIGEWFPRCHAVLMRAGALSLAEAALFGRPCLLVPYPFAADRHQEMNAEEFCAGGGGLWMRQEETSPDGVLEALEKWGKDPETLRRTGERAARRARPGAAEAIVRAVLAELGRGESGRV